ncbi:DUF4292 domain-containing protein [Flagellimonas sp. HMM57]|uniref:DUF4292 domain-containing protein n=1 Tax=unclassified Flagellimonas TaxID=2644544 RepID=UPI0013D87C5E|nr:MULTISPECIES: DUF4292 domain-containing protein [unclassified Flagellimonas]UII77547.1 DUF4292 domain-containing protein [Flagellimonas sp. HMM57]
MELTLDRIKAQSAALLFLVLIFGACKSKKAVTGGNIDEGISTKRIIAKHYTNQLDFKTLSGRVKIDYSNGDESQGVTVSLRMEKDKVIWISAPLGMVKAHITPERVSFYNKLQNEYFDGDFSYLSGLLGTDLDFDKVQNLLLGNAILDLREEKYTSTVNTKSYQLKPKKARELFKILFELEPKNFKIATQEISQPEKERQLSANYTYQDISGRVLPDEIKIEAREEDENTNIDLSFKSLELNRTLNFPYKVPKGFDKIVLK